MVEQKFDLGVVLIFGGAGFLGSHIVEALVEHSACSQIVVASRNPKAHWTFPNVSYHSLDISDKEAVDALLRSVKPTVIIDTVTANYKGRLAEAKRITIDGTKVLLDLASEMPEVKAFLYTSSQVGAPPDLSVRTEETAKLNTLTSKVSAYARTKGAVEPIVLAANGINLKTCVLRLTCLFGERDKATICNLYKTSKNANVVKMQIGDNTAFFDFLYAKNAAFAYLLASQALLAEAQALTEPSEAKVAGEAFYITDDEPTRMWDFSRSVWRAAGVKIPEQHNIRVIPFWLIIPIAETLEWLFYIFTFNTKKSPIPSWELKFTKGGYRFSIDKAKERLLYKPQYTTQEGVERSVRWFQEQEHNSSSATK